MVAQYADGCNVSGDAEQRKHLLGVLERHCEDAGRDPGEITKTTIGSIVIAETEDGVQSKLEAIRAAGHPEQLIQNSIAGTPEQVLEFAHMLREEGFDGITLSMFDVHDLDSVALAGETLAPVFAPATAR